jgi:HD superfamily phosphohydrolase
MLDDPTKRVRDPVHGLMVFRLTEEVDRAAWELINTPEFQRLRRVKQLGVSEFTFPGATHTRFSHCVGVYHVARMLVDVTNRFIPAANRNAHRARVALLAALLHDLGHGPFSHAFEEAEKSRLRNRPGAYKDHEAWTSEIIRRKDGKITEILTRHFGGGMADEIAALLTSEPADIYAAVVSSSFDADRLDYLQRDKMMSGSGAGSIDFSWLIDNIRTTEVSPETDDDDEEPSLPLGKGSPPAPITTFCFAEKAAQAAEAFILARYHLYSQVYFHHTTRGMEQVLAAFLKGVATLIAAGKHDQICISQDHPLAVFYGAETPTVDQYLALDDTAIWSAVESVARCGDALMRDWASRLRDRRRLKAIEIATERPTATDKIRREYIETKLRSEIGTTVFVDRVPLTIYGGIKAGETRSHKRVRILRSGDERAVDITLMSKAIAALTEKQEILRYYFVDDAMCDRVLEMRG